MDTFLTKRAPSTSSFDRSRSIERLERRSKSSWKRYDDSPERSNSPPYRSRDSKRYDPSPADRKKRSSSPYDRYDKSSSRRDRTSSLRIETKSPRYPDSGRRGTDSGSNSPVLRRPRLRKARSETRSEKYNRKEDDRLYDDEDRYRRKERRDRRDWKDDDRYYDDDDRNLKEDSGRGSGRRRDDFDDDRGRKEDRKSSSRKSRTKPNLSRRSSNFRMQLYHSLNVVDSTKGKIHSRSHDSGMSKRSLLDKEPSKVSYSFPQKTNRLERSEPIAMRSSRRWDDDDRDYSPRRHERKIEETLYGRSDDEEVFALDIEPLPKSRR